MDVDELRGALYSATSAEQLERVVEAADAACGRLAGPLGEYIATALQQHAAATQRVEVQRAGLTHTLGHADALLGLLAGADDLGNLLTARVRFIDAERDNVGAAMQLVAHIITLKRQVARCYECIDTGRWSEAAAAIGVIRDLPDGVITSEYAEMVVPSANVPMAPQQAVVEWSAQLKLVFVREFRAAAAARNLPQLTTYFKLFPLIGELATGVDVYLRFVCELVADLAHGLLALRDDTPMVYAQVAMRLFENVAAIVNQHGPLVVRLYGPEAMAECVVRIQREVDAQAGLIIDTFRDKRRVLRVVDEVKRYGYPVLRSMLQGTREATPDRAGSPAVRQLEDGGVIEVGDLVAELAAILSKWAMYVRFIRVKWHEYHGEDGDVVPLANSGFSAKLGDEYLEIFHVLSNHYFRRSLEKAYTIEELPEVAYAKIVVVNDAVVPPEQPLVLLVVEDLTLVLNTCLRAGCDSGQAELCRDTVVSLRRMLDTDVLAVWSKRFRDLMPRGGGGFQGTGGAALLAPAQTTLFQRGASYASAVMHQDHDQRLGTWVVLLNLLVVAKGYLLRVVAKTVAELVVPGFPDAADAERLGLLASGLAALFGTKLDEMVQQHVNTLFDQACKARLRVVVTEFFSQVSFMVLADLSESLDDGAQALALFTASWTKMAAPFIRTMAPEVWDRLATALAHQMAYLVEDRIWALDGRINELGAVQLELNILLLVDTVTRTGRYGLKEHFLKVNQMVLMLALDDELEELDIAWVLTPQERHRARHMRVDRKGI